MWYNFDKTDATAAFTLTWTHFFFLVFFCGCYGQLAAVPFWFHHKEADWLHNSKTQPNCVRELDLRLEISAIRLHCDSYMTYVNSCYTSMSANNSEQHITESGHVYCAKKDVLCMEKLSVISHLKVALCVVAASIVGKTVRQ